jgi:hypothetical protein
VRFIDPENHYRFDESAGKEKGTVAQPPSAVPEAQTRASGPQSLVKVVRGQEKELAAAEGVATPPIEMSGEQALAFTMAKWAFVKDDRRHRGEYWNGVEENTIKAVDNEDGRCWKVLEERLRADLAKGPLRICRYAVEVNGGRIVCRANGREVLSADDGDLKRGTVGFRCQGGGRWDDLIVSPRR